MTRCFVKFPALILCLSLASCAVVPPAASYRALENESSTVSRSADSSRSDTLGPSDMCDRSDRSTGAETEGSTTAAPVRSNRVSGYFGMRQLDGQEYFESVEDQLTFGVQFSQEQPEWVVGWEAGGMFSIDSEEEADIRVSAATAEGFVGARKTFGSGTVRPYLGAGISYISVAVDSDEFLESDHDGSFGLYAHGGVNFHISSRFSLGLDARGLFGTDIEIYETEADADYVQFAVVAGYSF